MFDSQMTIMNCSLGRVFPFQRELVREAAVTRLYPCQNILLVPKDSKANPIYKHSCG